MVARVRRAAAFWLAAASDAVEAAAKYLRAGQLDRLRIANIATHIEADT